jgi:hypothetical protein
VRGVPRSRKYAGLAQQTEVIVPTRRATKLESGCTPKRTTQSKPSSSRRPPITFLGWENGLLRKPKSNMQLAPNDPRNKGTARDAAANAIMQIATSAPMTARDLSHRQPIRQRGTTAHAV